MMWSPLRGASFAWAVPQPKPETDPEWEARKAERKLKRAQSMEEAGM